MPKVISQGIGVHYETEGTGAPLVLQHGVSNSLEFWRDFGYAQRLRKSYRLILIDARGHGMSDVPSREEDCSTELMASDVLAVLDALGIERAHYWGYSMGGWIGFHLGGMAPHRFFSMVLGGAHPYPEDLSDFRELLRESGPAAIVPFWDAIGAPLSETSRERLLHHPMLPLLAIARHDRPDLSASLVGMKMPLLFYAGDEDPWHEGARACARSLPNAQWFSLPGLDHLAAFSRSDFVLPPVQAFLQSVMIPG